VLQAGKEGTGHIVLLLETAGVNRPAQRSVGGIITAGLFTPAVSKSKLYDQFLLSLLEARTIGAPGININYISGELAPLKPRASGI